MRFRRGAIVRQKTAVVVTQALRIEVVSVTSPMIPVLSVEDVIISRVTGNLSQRDAAPLRTEADEELEQMRVITHRSHTHHPSVLRAGEIKGLTIGDLVEDCTRPMPACNNGDAPRKQVWQDPVASPVARGDSTHATTGSS